jgi:hypothetical protein
VKLWLAALLACWPLAAQDRFAKLGRDLQMAASELGISDLRAAVVQSGRVVWKYGAGAIKAPAPEEPVIAERVPKALLDTPAPALPGATIRQMLSNTADGTPGEEILDNHAFFDALKPMAGNKPMPDAIRFAKQQTGALGWFHQDLSGEQVLWSFAPSLLMVRLPAKQLALVVSANSHALTEAARLEDGNIARSTIAMAFLGDALGRDELIDHALIALYRGQNEKSAALVHQALDRFPGIESTPDVTLLYLFAQLRLPETQDSATAVIKDHPSLPTAWFYYGQYLENNKRYREAAACFEKITMHQPPWHNWTMAAAKKELTYLKTN